MIKLIIEEGTERSTITAAGEFIAEVFDMCGPVQDEWTIKLFPATEGSFGQKLPIVASGHGDGFNEEYHLIDGSLVESEAYHYIQQAWHNKENQDA